MHLFFRTSLILLLVTSSVPARNWTDQKGRNVDAEVITVNPDRTVILKTRGGKTVTVPFDTFVDEDVRHLDGLLAQQGRGKLHEVPWDKMNELFGLRIWQDDLLWDDSTEDAGKRMALAKESKTAFMENHRAYPLGRKKILGQDVYAIALYGRQQHADSISLIFLNLGDIPSGASPAEVAEKIETAGMRIHDKLLPLLGKPERDSLGRGDLREKIWRWDWNGHAIMLSIQEGKYAAMRIMPTDRADRSGRIAKITDSELKTRMLSCVEKRDNGDVVINNIPMINQGPKGYCSPATWERYLRYLDIPVDMYLLALAANTGAGGGTYSQDMIDATGNIISSNGRKLRISETKLTVKKISQHIDKGLPIMWGLMSTPEFQQAANANTARRKGKTVRPKKAGQSEDTGSGGHICLIIGYNPKTGEVAISDSWGPRFSERWVSLSAIQEASVADLNGYTYKFKWCVISW